jgi:outer membrane lipoprotein-sorting protein
VAAPALIAAGVGVASIPAQADIPAKTPAQVVALAAGSHVSAFSGSLRQSSDLGLPSLTGLPGGGGADSDGGGVVAQLEMLTSPHTARVYVDGATRQRVQVFSGSNEKDVVRDGTSAWIYDSQTQTATRVRGIPQALDSAATTPHAMTPQDVADTLLGALTPTTRLTVTGTPRVAGRDAYQLELQPKPDGTLIGAVRIDVDAKTGMALVVTITARGDSSPAFSVAFTSLSLATPPAARFDFTPPADARVHHLTVPHSLTSGRSDSPHPRGMAGHTGPTVIGSGWISVVEAQVAAKDVAGVLRGPLATRLSTAVPGGRLFSSALLNVYVTDSGRVFAGAVQPAVLYAAAQRNS